jgi:acetyltransferase-like isoleucine patch superfamily enzyme
MSIMTGLGRLSQWLAAIERLRAHRASQRVRRKCGRLGEGLVCGAGTRLYLEGASPAQVSLGKYVSLLETDLICYAKGSLTIGDYCWFSLRTQVISATSVIIGPYSIFARDVYISDTNEHPVDPMLRRRETIAALETGKPPDRYLAETRPVVIGSDVWVGERAVILKGVRIGDAAVVAANSVVTRDVPAYSVVAGNPARVVKEIPRSVS